MLEDENTTQLMIIFFFQEVNISFRAILATC